MAIAIQVIGLVAIPSFTEIAAGLATVLFGMIVLEEDFRAFIGGLLERTLASTTDRLWKSGTLGLVSSAVLQSSSLDSVITISFSAPTSRR